MSFSRTLITKATSLSLLGLTLFGSLSLVPNSHTAVQAQTVANFSVRGGKIYAPDGSEFVIKGTNVNGPNWMWPGDTTTDVSSIVDCWKFNLVRANAILFPQWYHRTDNNDLDKLVNTFTSRKVVVMFEAHDRTGSYFDGQDLEALKSWYRGLATRYKNNPYVWFNIQNEPDGLWPLGFGINLDTSKWVSMHQQVIQVIRDEVGANNVIVVDGSTWGQDTGTSRGNIVADNQSAILSSASRLTNFNGKTYNNIVFSIHVYQEWNYGDAKMIDFFNRAAAKGIAVIVGEYGSMNTPTDTKPATQTMFNVTVPRKIGRIVWHWNGGDDNDLTTSQNGGGVYINSCTSPTNLTWLGQKVWADNRATSTTSPTTTTTSPTTTTTSPTPTPINGTDLIITGLKVKQSAYNIGDRVQFELTVKNQGNVAAPNTWLNLAAYVNGNKVAWSGAMASLPAGGTQVITSSDWIVSATTFKLSALIDDANTVPETNETNNSLAVDITPPTSTSTTSTSIPGTDLVITGLKVKQSAYNIGDQVQFELTVKNQGTVATPNTWLNLSAYVDGVKVAWGGSMALIPAGGTQTFTSSNWQVAKTTFKLGATIDDTNNVAEVNESNNGLTVGVGI